MGRRPIKEGVRRDELPPTQRGFFSVNLPEDVKQLLDQYGAAQGIPQRRPTARVKHLTDYPAVIRHLHERATQPAPAPQSQPQEAPSIPWDRLKEAFVAEFGFVHEKRVDQVIASLREELKEG